MKLSSAELGDHGEISVSSFSVRVLLRTEVNLVIGQLLYGPSKAADP